jgi:deoxyribose-phosphate aldolase
MDSHGHATESYDSLAALIEQRLLDARMSEDEAAEQCRRARQLGVAAVLVRPSDLDQAVRILEGSSIEVGSTVGYPDGSSTTAVKLYEARDLLRRGARYLECTVNVGKMRSRQFQHVEMELLQMAKACHEAGAKLCVEIHSDWLEEDLRFIALKIAKRVEADFLGLRDESSAVQLAPLTKERIQLRGLAGSLDEALRYRSLGCARIGSPGAEALLAAWRQSLQPPAPATA